MFEKLTVRELEQFNYLIYVLYESVMQGKSKVEPYPNAIDTVKDKLNPNEYCNVMETLEKDGYSMTKNNNLVLTQKGVDYAKQVLNL